MPDRPPITVEYDGPSELQPVVVATRNPALRPGDRVTVVLNNIRKPPLWVVQVAYGAPLRRRRTFTSERYADQLIETQLVRVLAEFRDWKP